jgi:hypothetical protein
MNNGIMWHKLVEQRHQELIQETEMYWLNRQFSEVQERRRPMPVVLRARLARMLIVWGEALLPRGVSAEGQRVIVQ